MRCSVKTCRNEGASRIVVIASGVLAGERVGVRLQLPIVACVAHSHPGAFWAALLRTIPRAFSALLASFGVAVPRLRHARVRFVPISTRSPRPLGAVDPQRELRGHFTRPDAAARS
jgi:hypothetical protein